MPSPSNDLRFDVARETDLDAIRRLTHRTFAEEISQHQPSADGRLIDKFEREQQYIVARHGDQVVGMLALRTVRPFSLDGKLSDLDSYLPEGRRPCEVRLLAVEPGRRNGTILRGLLERLVAICDAGGFDVAVMSGTTRQLRLYKHLGCVPFGPLVGRDDALFQPMYVTREALLAAAGEPLRMPVTTRIADSRTAGSRIAGSRPAVLNAIDDAGANFLTGPVGLAPAVRARLREPLESHRGERVASDLAHVKATLCGMTEARAVHVACGSGTFANELVAAQLRATGEPGLVVATGEFGERLAEHAACATLPHAVLRRPWGESVAADDLAAAVARAGARWIWIAHCETSTGVLHDLDMVREVAARSGARLAVDAISSVATVPVSLRHVSWATASSGKGLGAVAGLALVFTDAPPIPAAPGTPRVLDLARYAADAGIPFTVSSLLVGALSSALETTDWPDRFRAIASSSERLRDILGARGHQPLAVASRASPAVATWRPVDGVSSAEAGAALANAGYQVGWQSGYLRARNCVQTAFMGDFPEAEVSAMASALADALEGRTPARRIAPAFRAPGVSA